jgi:hypothetical protein
MSFTDPMMLNGDMIEIGGGSFVSRAALADALIRAGYLTAAGTLPGKGLLGGIVSA